MPGPRPRFRRRAALPLAALFLSFPLFLLVFIPNPVTDALASAAATASLGLPVSFKGVRLERGRAARFLEAELTLDPSWLPVVARDGRASAGREGRIYLDLRELDLEALGGKPGTTASDFLRKRGLQEWMLVRDSRWVLTRGDGTVRLGLLSSSMGEGALKGGILFDTDGPARVNAAVWIPASMWRHVPELVGKKFAEDASGRRLFKLTWSRGRWTLWGRSSPVLEATWR